MKKNVMLIAAILVFIPILLFAQVNQDSIYIWDNDRGESNQWFPAVGSRTWGAYVGWQDSRWGEFDIYRQGVYWNGTMNGNNYMVSVDSLNRYLQTNVDLEASPGNMVVCVWEDSACQAGAVTQIYARRYLNPPFRVYGGSRSSRNPAVSCRDNGYFVVSFTNYDPSVPRIMYSSYDSLNNQIGQNVVRGEDSVYSHSPQSRVAYCDSGFVIVYEDSSRDGTQRSIYLQYRRRDGSVVTNRIKASRYSMADTYNEDYPDVAVNRFGFVVVVWMDLQYGSADPDVRCQTFQMRPGAGTIEPRGPYYVAGSSLIERYPKATVFADNENNFMVVWDQRNDNPTHGYDVWGRLGLLTGMLNPFQVNIEDTLNQGWPDVSCRNSDTFSIAWMSDVYSKYEDIFVRHYRRDLGYSSGVCSLTNDIQVVSSDTVGGRRAWYFDDENYDNPLTPGWNEDPIDEPDSIYVDLDYAMVDQINELNTNNQYVIFNQDTLPRRQYGRDLTAFDAVFLDLGYRTDDASAGVISNTEQTTLCEYINPGSGTGQPAMVEGNDFGYMYDGTLLFDLFHATYKGDGAPYQTGNIDTLYGEQGMFAAGETLKYSYKELVDNYPDSFTVRDGKIILQSTGAPGRWIAGRSVGWSNAWKDRAPANTILNGFPLSGIRSNTHPHTYAEYYRRCLGFLGLNCQPEPITTLLASTGASEGRVTITWNVVSDDSLKESAEGPYMLKFARDKMTSEPAFNDSSETYYQNWYTRDSAVGAMVTQNLYGLPPMDTLIFALKVSDEDTLWDALGAEPMAIVAGDSVTPHVITMGANYVKDFSNAFEFMDRRRPNDTGTNYDSLFVTWSGTYFYLGFARCNFRTEGDLFIYVDTKTGGADSTVGYNGASGKSAFIPTFIPDYVFILEDSGTYSYKRWVPSKDRGSWQDTTFTGSFVTDNIVNNLLYNEIAIRFTGMVYTVGAPFKLVVIVQNETTNQINNAFPISNPLGSSQLVAAYYYWDGGLVSGLVPNKSYTIVGVAEEQELPVKGSENTRLTIEPNPFSTHTVIRLPQADKVFNPKGTELMIYDATGRLVKNFLLPTAYSILPAAFSWDGSDDEGNKLPEGVYFCQFKSSNIDEVVKIIHVK